MRNLVRLRQAFGEQIAVQRSRLGEADAMALAHSREGRLSVEAFVARHPGTYTAHRKSAVFKALSVAGRTRQDDMLTLQGNLVNLHSGKYSGLANNKVIDISAGPDGSITVTKVQADGGKVASTKRQSTLRRSTGPRRANKIAAVETAHKGFRPDLRQVSTSQSWKSA